jgi:hypothetical protein
MGDNDLLRVRCKKSKKRACGREIVGGIVVRPGPLGAWVQRIEALREPNECERGGVQQRLLILR